MRSLLAPVMIDLRTPPLALRNVMQGRVRSAVAIAGIGFAVVMVLLQLGFLEAVKITAAINYDQLDFDVALVSSDFEQFYDPGRFPGDRLKQALAVPGVTAARPFWARMSLWRCPPYPVDAPVDAPAPDLSALRRWWLGSKRPRPWQRRELLVLGIDLDRNPFREPIRGQVRAAEPQLRLADRVLLNAWSNPDFGWGVRDRFDGWELGGRKVEVVGDFTLLRSFGADASVLTSGDNFARAFGLPTPDAAVNFGLIALAPGTSADAVARQLNRRLPAGVQALTRAALYDNEANYWVRQTATGRIFAFGVFVTMIVAAVVVYQVLSNDIRNRLPEYATLKAMGYTNRFLSRVVLTQAAIYALAAYLPAVVVSLGLYRLTESLATIPMRLTWFNLGLVLGLTVLSALGSGVLTVRKLGSANPADLY